MRNPYLGTGGMLAMMWSEDRARAIAQIKRARLALDTIASALASAQLALLQRHRGRVGCSRCAS
jgi:hypothetical protein